MYLSRKEDERGGVVGMVCVRPHHDIPVVAVAVVADALGVAAHGNAQQRLLCPLSWGHPVYIGSVSRWWEVGFDNMHRLLPTHNHLQQVPLAACLR